MHVYLLATLDTKGREIAYVRDLLREQQITTVVVDTGCVGPPAIAADIPRDAVFGEAGVTLEEMQSRGDRGQAVAMAAKGAAALVGRHHSKGQLAGILGIGGSAGTSIVTAAMRCLPLGVPKL